MSKEMIRRAEMLHSENRGTENIPQRPQNATAMNCVQYTRTNVTINVTSIGLFQELRDEKGT